MAWPAGQASMHVSHITAPGCKPPWASTLLYHRRRLRHRHPPRHHRRLLHRRNRRRRPNRRLLHPSKCCAGAPMRPAPPAGQRRARLGAWTAGATSWAARRVRLLRRPLCIPGGAGDSVPPRRPRPRLPRRRLHRPCHRRLPPWRASDSSAPTIANPTLHWGRTGIATTVVRGRSTASARLGAIAPTVAHGS